MRYFYPLDISKNQKYHQLLSINHQLIFPILCSQLSVPSSPEMFIMMLKSLKKTFLEKALFLNFRAQINKSVNEYNYKYIKLY